MDNEIRKKLQDIVDTNDLKRPEDRCSTIRSELIRGFGSGPTVKTEFESKRLVKEAQVACLKTYATKNGLWFDNLPNDFIYLTKGGESKVYLDQDGLNVFKINDAVYYATWAEYFTSLVIHNLLFPNTAYDLIGFTEIEKNCMLSSSSHILKEGRQNSKISGNI